LRVGAGAAARWRAGGAGAATDGGSEGDTISRAGVVVAAGGTVGGTALCATGRAFGSGTLCFAGAEAACFAAGESAGFTGDEAFCFADAEAACFAGAEAAGAQ
jgi:hypothetical protein